MAENNMPVAEAVGADQDERSQYEFAFHILPTVTEEEVPRVFGELKTLIDHAGGEIITEEAPQHFELAYDVVKHTEGKNYKFAHSYFGWVRFMLLSDKLEHLKTEIEHNQNVLRFMLLRLSKAEVAQPFRIFESLKKEKKEDDATDSKADKEVSEEDIDRSLGEITA